MTNGGLSRNRTNDTRIFSPLLYQLSYETTWLREKDLNQRPPGYEPDELPDCSIPRYLIFKCLIIIAQGKTKCKCFFEISKNIFSCGSGADLHRTRFQRHKGKIRSFRKILRHIAAQAARHILRLLPSRFFQALQE